METPCFPSERQARPSLTSERRARSCEVQASRATNCTVVAIAVQSWAGSRAAKSAHNIVTVFDTCVAARSRARRSVRRVWSVAYCFTLSTETTKCEASTRVPSRSLCPTVGVCLLGNLGFGAAG